MAAPMIIIFNLFFPVWLWIFTFWYVIIKSERHYNYGKKSRGWSFPLISLRKILNQFDIFSPSEITGIVSVKVSILHILPKWHWWLTPNSLIAVFECHGEENMMHVLTGYERKYVTKYHQFYTHPQVHSTTWKSNH